VLRLVVIVLEILIALMLSCSASVGVVTVKMAEAICDEKHYTADVGCMVRGFVQIDDLNI